MSSTEIFQIKTQLADRLPIQDFSQILDALRSTTWAAAPNQVLTLGSRHAARATLYPNTTTLHHPGTRPRTTTSINFY